jgi:hypothetical protein
MSKRPSEDAPLKDKPDSPIRSKVEGVLGDGGKIADIPSCFEAEVGEPASPSDAGTPDAKTADTSELIEKLNLAGQWNGCLDTLADYGFTTDLGEAKEGNADGPSYDEVISSFSYEELEIASHFQQPTLLLIPENSFAAKIKALDTHKKGPQKNDTSVHLIFKDSDSSSDKITGWRAVIVDGANEMKAYEGDDLGAGFGARIRKRRKVRKPREKGMDRHIGALLMMKSLRGGDPIKKRLHILLDDDPALSDSHVPYMFFDPDDHNVVFDEAFPGYLLGEARFRSSVGGNALLNSI